MQINNDDSFDNEQIVVEEEITWNYITPEYFE